MSRIRSMPMAGPFLILWGCAVAALLAFIPQDDEDSEHCRRFRQWQAGRTDFWHDTIFVLTNCEDMSEEAYFDVASRFGKHTDSDHCEDASTYMQWFRDAWNFHADSPQFRISYDAAYTRRGEENHPEPGFYARDSLNAHYGFGIRNDYLPGPAVHEVYHYVRPDLNEADVKIWEWQTATECYDLEEEEEDDEKDDDDNNDNNNGNNGGGGGSGESDGGGGGNGTETCTTSTTTQSVYVSSRPCETSDGEDGGTPCLPNSGPDGEGTSCGLPGLEVCMTSAYWIDIEITETTCTLN